MHDALWAKTCALGAYADVRREIDRITPWLPYTLRPLVWELQHWITRHRNADEPEERLRIEQEALSRLRLKLIQAPEHAFLTGVLRQAEQALRQSRTQRQAVLRGAQAADGELDDVLFSELTGWIRRHRTPRNRTLAAVIMRVLAAWRYERRGDVTHHL